MSHLPEDKCDVELRGAGMKKSLLVTKPANLTKKRTLSSKVVEKRHLKKVIKASRRLIINKYIRNFQNKSINHLCIESH